MALDHLASDLNQNEKRIAEINEYEKNFDFLVDYILLFLEKKLITKDFIFAHESEDGFRKALLGEHHHKLKNLDRE